jgi:hypothetical protein
MSITVQINPSTERRLREDAEKKGVSLDQYLASFLERHFSSGQPERLSVSKREAELLQKINLDISPETWAEYAQLKEKRLQRTITETELERSQAIAEQIEIANAKRLEVLVELSKIRGISLRALMEELGINQKNND